MLLRLAGLRVNASLEYREWYTNIFSNVLKKVIILWICRVPVLHWCLDGYEIYKITNCAPNLIMIDSAPVNMVTLLHSLPR